MTRKKMAARKSTSSAPEIAKKTKSKEDSFVDLVMEDFFEQVQVQQQKMIDELAKVVAIPRLIFLILVLVEKPIVDLTLSEWEITWPIK